MQELSNKVKVIIGIVVLSFVLLIAVWISFLNQKDVVDDISDIDSVEDVDVDKEEITEDSPDNVKDYDKVEKGDELLGDDEAHDLTESAAKTALKEARFLVSEFKFKEAEEAIYTIVSKYNLNGNDYYASILRDVHYDIPVMAFLDEHEINMNIEGVRGTLEQIVDIENYIVGVMSLKAKTRIAIIFRDDSINPSFTGNIEVGEIKDVDHKNMKLLSALEGRINDIAKVREVSFNIEGNELLAYVVTNSEGYHTLYTIIEKEEGSTHYITNDEWKELFGKGGKLDDKGRGYDYE